MWFIMTGCGGPKACPSTMITVVSRGGGKMGDAFQSKSSTPKRTELKSGFSKVRKKVSTKDKGNPFGFDPNYQYPTRKEEKGLFSKKVMKSWKKY